MAKSERRGLGRGLSALMADVDMGDTAEAEQSEEAKPRRAEVQIPIEQIEPNPDQPRRTFETDTLDDLAASIARKGVIQPLILREHPTEADRYQIVAGERRWRAAQIAQLHELPAIVRHFDDIEVLEVAIIENIQRADLNPVEEAAGYRQLMDRFGHTQEQMADALGKSRSHIANALRLLNLPGDVQGFLAEGKLSAGHARALIPAENASEIARQIVAKNLTVRQVEALMRKPKPGAKKSAPEKTEKSPDIKALESDLSTRLGMRVVVDHQDGKPGGKVTISYNSLDQFDDLCRTLSGGLS